MDISMILGLTLAGAIMLLNGDKRSEKDQKPRTSGKSEFVVSVGGDGAISVSPKQKSSKDS